MVTQFSIFPLFMISAMASTAYSADFTDAILLKFKIAPTSSLYGDIYEELNSDSYWKSLTSSAKSAEAEAYAHTIIASEFHRALTHPEYSAQKYSELLPFMEQEVKSGSALGKEIKATGKQALDSRYGPEVLRRIELQTTFLNQASDIRVSSRALGKTLSKMTLPEQMKAYARAFRQLEADDPTLLFFKKRLASDLTSTYYRPERLKTPLFDSYRNWAQASVGDAAKNPEKFMNFFRGINAGLDLPLGGQFYGEGIQKMLKAEASLENASRLKKLKHAILGPSEKSLKAAVDEIKLAATQANPRLPVEEKLTLAALAKSQGNSRDLSDYLYGKPSRFDGQNADRLANIFASSDFSLSPDASDELSMAMKKFFEQKGTQYQIGPASFAKMIDENPALAKKLSEKFYQTEFLPAMGTYFENNQEKMKVGKSVDRIFKHIADSGDSAVKTEFQNLVLNADATTRLRYLSGNHFSKFLPLLDTDARLSAKGSRVIFLQGDPKVMDPEAYRNATKRYFTNLAKNPAQMLEDFKESDKILSTINQKNFLSELFKNDPKTLGEFSKSYLATSSVVKGRVLDTDFLSKAAKSYESVLKDYVTYGNPTPEEFEAAHANFKSAIDFPKTGKYGSAAYQDIAKRGPDFNEWYHNPAKGRVINVDETVANLNHFTPGTNCDYTDFLKAVTTRN